MNIFEFAMKMEKDGEDYYRELAKEAANPGLTSIFTMLADAEVKHYHIVDRLRRDESQPEMAEDTLFDDTKNVFVQMKEEQDTFRFDASQKDVYRKALDIEKESHAFYKEKAGEVDTDAKKALLLKLAEEEKRHMFLMENIIEFTSRPETWLENAEWYHLDEY
jgi:rubrerythrin